MLGMKNPRNVAQNLQIAATDPLEPEDFWELLKLEGKKEKGIRLDIW